MFIFDHSVCHTESIKQWLAEKQLQAQQRHLSRKRPAEDLADQLPSKHTTCVKRRFARTVELTRILLLGDMSTASFPERIETVDDASLIAKWQCNRTAEFEYASVVIGTRDGLKLLDNEMLRSNENASSDEHVNAFFALARMYQEQIMIITNLQLVCRDTIFSAEMTVLVDIDKFQSSRSFSELLNILCPSPKVDLNVTIQDFLQHLQPPISTETIHNCVPDGLVPTLTPFQSQNVQWMLEREGHVAHGRDNLACIPHNTKTVPFLWESILLDSDQTIYVNRVSRQILAEWTPDLEYASRCRMRGGILADEMGLGKTVSAIALILLHKLNPADPCHPDPSTKTHDGLLVSQTTLIITPRAIFQQWESEIARHAPHLRVMVYNGMKVHKSFSPADFSRYDVVLTDYEVLQREIYYARPKSDRPRRHAAKYPIGTSPLVKVKWWRCMLDEAQMVESSVAHTAEMARLIPRVNSWAITGTPMRAKYDDLYGLYLFLGLTPFCNKPNLFRNLHRQPELRGLFWSFTKETIRRNMKALLKNQVHIPPQQRLIVNVSFSPIEKHRYDDLWELCCEETSLRWLEESEWKFPEAPGEDARRTKQNVYAKLRSWLLRLRQTCVHPGVGGYSKRQMDETVRTLEDVLSMMIQQTKEKLDKSRLSLLRTLLHRGGMYEVLREWEVALGVYLETLPRVEEMADQATVLVEQAKKREAEAQLCEIENISHGKEITRDKNRDVSLTNLVSSQRVYLQLLHRFYFYIAGLYHELGKEDDENLYYDKAASCRQRMLAHAKEKVNASVEDMEKTPLELDLKKTYIGCTAKEEAGRSLTEIADRVDMVFDKLNEQLSCITEWRSTIRTMLCNKLDDQEMEEVEEEDMDIYQKSLVSQEECSIYQDAYRDILHDRTLLLSGHSATNHPHQALDENREGQCQEDNLSKKLYEKRQKYLPPMLEGYNNIRQMITELKDVMSDPDTSPTKHGVCRQLVNRLTKESTNQRKQLEEFESEYRRFTMAYNYRVEYYKSLQTISDRVIAWESENPKAEIRTSLREEKKLQTSIAEQVSRHRYLTNLAEQENNLDNENDAEDQRLCLICQAEFSKGIITYCTVTIARIPGSKRAKGAHNAVQVFNDINAREVVEMKQPGGSSQTALNGVASSELLAQIGRCRIKEGLGAKMDSIIRHIKFIKETTNGKCVVFSQWNQVLGLLGEGLQKNQIGFVDFAKSRLTGGLLKFRDDPDTNVILLHARSHSSGLSLVCAQTVFIIEPVLNEVLEKQAISRIHRIGQTKETAVFWYIVRDTIEERIQVIHNAKQQQNAISGADKISESALTQALEKISSGGGELVSDEDLRRCFSKDIRCTTDLTEE
ncbi:hypothetical protein DFQ30_010533 [Apophysomyces sp. BC1015]|nr:hypothetical protein DFQ30_010533 [Apophysomyces sp. BC1015]